MHNQDVNTPPLLITICILIYKDISQLHIALDRIISQTYPRLELIISDDGSDNISISTIKSIASPYKNRFENIHINKNQTNVGTVQHINKLLPMVNGDILCIIGADDKYFDNTVIEDVAKYFIDNPDKMILTSKRLDETDSKIRPSQKAQNILNNHFHKYQKLMFRAEPIISGAGTFYHMNIFRKYGNFPNAFKLIEDASFYTFLISHGVEFGFLNRVTCVHNKNGVSDSSAPPHPWFEADKKYLYTTWMKTLSKDQDYFTKRCVKYRSTRIVTQNTTDLLKLYIKYWDVSIYLLWIYKFMHWE